MSQRLGALTLCVTTVTVMVGVAGCGATSDADAAEGLARRVCGLVDDMASGRMPLDEERLTEAVDLAARADRLDPTWHFLYLARKNVRSAFEDVPKDSSGAAVAISVTGAEMAKEDEVCPRLSPPHDQ